MSRYRLFIDESGDHTFNQLDKAEHRYLALLGIWFESAAYKQFESDLVAFKDGIFGRRHVPVILHREDIIKKRGPFRMLVDPETQATFDAGLLGVISAADFRMCCVVIDKQTHEVKQYRATYHPYHYCLAALMERYAGLLDRSGDVGDVMAESRGGTEDMQLKSEFHRIYNLGTQWHSARQFQKVLTSRDLKLRKKLHCIAGLELADILANPIKRYVVAENFQVPPKCGPFGDQIVAAASPKFNRQLYNLRVWGYGKVFLS